MKKPFYHFVIPGLLVLSLFSFRLYADDDPIRLISTDAFVTELLFSLNADEYLVAVDVTSKLPDDYRPLANIGYHRTLSAEAILNLRPTQVIGSEFIGPPEVLSVLHHADINLIQLPSALTAEQLRSNITTLAKTVSRQKSATQLLEHMGMQMKLLQEKPLKNTRMAFLLSISPDTLRLAGNNTNGNAFIALTQADNVAAFNNYQNVSAESLLALKPEIIVVAGRDPENAVAEVLAANPILKHTPAGQNAQIIAIDGNTLVAGLSPSAIDEALILVNSIEARIPR